MEEQIRKLKTKTYMVIVLGLLAITWQFLSYLTIKDHINIEDFSSVEAVLIYSSYIFLAIFFIAILSLLYTVMRVSMKYRSDKKKEEKARSETAAKIPEADNQEL
jgi:hypothetical protein